MTGSLAGALSVGHLWGQHRAGVLHPAAIPFATLRAVTVPAASVGTAAGLWRSVRGPRRPTAAAWGLVGFLPLGLWAGLAAYTLHLAAAGQAFPRHVLSDVATMAVASLMEGWTPLAYPHRLDSRRLVMFYDDRVTDPRRDLEAMDRHIAALEAVTGEPSRAKIHLGAGRVVRPSADGDPQFVLGSSHGPADQDTADRPSGVVALTVTSWRTPSSTSSSRRTPTHRLCSSRVGPRRTPAYDPGAGRNGEAVPRLVARAERGRSGRLLSA